MCVCSATVYLEALEISSELDLEHQQGMSTLQRIHARARVLEMAAMASHTFAAIQYSKVFILIVYTRVALFTETHQFVGRRCGVARWPSTIYSSMEPCSRYAHALGSFHTISK